MPAINDISIIQSSDNLSEEEKRILFGWGADIFNDHGTVFQPEEWHFKIYEDNRLSGHVGVTKNQLIMVGDREVFVGGISNVVTPPEARGKGYASQLMGQAIIFMCLVLKPDYGMLLCWPGLIPFYGKLGWSEVRGIVHYLQPSGRTKGKYSIMVYSCMSTLWPGGDIEINGLPW